MRLSMAPVFKSAIIRISATVDSDTLVLTIRDNGGGMSGENMEMVNHNLAAFHSVSNESGSIGLANTNKRIQLAFNSNDYGVRIVESGDDGTTVRIMLPCVQGKERCNVQSVRRGG